MNKRTLLATGFAAIAFANTASATSGDLALNAIATVQQSKHNSNTAHMNDGSNYTAWRSNPLYNYESVQVTLDWTSVQNMNSVEIQWSGADYAREITVWTHEGNSWTSQGTIYGSGTNTVIKLVNGTTTSHVLIDLGNSNSSYFSIEEIIVE